MADTINLAGRLADITSASVENITGVTVKAPRYAPGPAFELTTTQPQQVELHGDGEFAINVVEGVGWLYIDGDGWSDTVRFVAKEGMTRFIDAVLNSGPWPVPLPLVRTGIEQIQDEIRKAIQRIAAQGDGWYKGQISADYADTLDGIEPGAYELFVSAAQKFGIPGGRYSVLMAHKKEQIAFTNDGVQPLAYRRTRLKGKWTPWVLFGSNATGPYGEGSGFDAAAMEPGVHTLFASAAKENDLPGGTFGHLWSAGALKPRQYWFTTIDGEAKTFMRNTPEEAWQDLSANTGNGRDDHNVAVARVRRVTEARRVKGVGLALVFDHGTNNFNEVILPMLRERNLPATIALNSQMYDPEQSRYQYDNRTTWETVRGWAEKDGIEIANHGRTHKTIRGEAELTHEIVGGLEELRDALPGVLITSWVQHAGVPQITDVAEYSTRSDGRDIWTNHAAATCASLQQRWPLTGDTGMGLTRFWYDTPTGAVSIRNQILQTPAGWGTIASTHPEVMGQDGKVTAEDYRAFFDWVVEQRDAGALDVMTLRELAIAQAA